VKKRVVSALLVLATLLAGASAAGDARAEKPKTSVATKDAKGADAKRSSRKKDAPMSVGAPNQGKLRGARKLRVTDDVIAKKNSSSWGLPELTNLLQRAARKVRKKHGGPALLVGDLSAKLGGPLVGHNSHQSGRDADLGFFVTNSKGKPFRATRFLPFDDAGVGKDVPWARFDDVRNWALVRALLTDEQVNVRHIFVTAGLEARLLAYAKQKKEPEELLTRAALVLMAPKDADVHDDHFHIRIACPESMRGTCVDDSLPKGAAAPKADGEVASGATPAKEPPAQGVAALAEKAAAEAVAEPAPKPGKPGQRDDDPY
jgi:penicillin-insensitive murein endopeptidase